jgi:hypothetical protein
MPTTLEWNDIAPALSVTFLLDTQPDHGAEEDGFMSIDPNLAMSW